MPHTPTVGVEEEFLLVDLDARPLPMADAVLDRLTTHTETAEPPRFKPELQPIQVEAISEVHATMDGLASDLCKGRADLADAGNTLGISVLPVGTAPARYQPLELPATVDRHADIHRRYTEMTRAYTACGTHVHVGVADPESAVAVVNHLRPWLATLIAVGANSPFHEGRDTGYSSWRIAEQAQFPGSGLPPYARSAGDYQDQVARLVECGVLVDSQMSFWLARPSQAYPTVEVRAADAAATVEDAVLQAVLTRGLVAAAMRNLDAGIEGPHIDEQVGAAAVWSAAAYGLTGPAVDPIDGTRIPAVDMLDKLLTWIGDDLDETGDAELAKALVTMLDIDGTGAARQRRTVRRGLCDLVTEFRLTGDVDGAADAVMLRPLVLAARPAAHASRSAYGTSRLRPEDRD